MSEYELYKEVKQYNILLQYDPSNMFNSSISNDVNKIMIGSNNKYLRSMADILLKQNSIFRSSYAHIGNPSGHRLVQIQFGSLDLAKTGYKEEYDTLNSELGKLKIKAVNSILDKYIEEGCVYYIDVRERLAKKIHSLEKNISAKAYKGGDCSVLKSKLLAYQELFANSSGVTQYLI